LAARASSVESTPPENATTTRSSPQQVEKSVVFRLFTGLMHAPTDEVLELGVAPVDLPGIQPARRFSEKSSTVNEAITEP
jgi:hypothetical protein